MKDDTRNKALLELVRQGLEYSSACNTHLSLGNRAEYLGLSELARYSECPRAALAGKILARQNSLEQLLTLQRGHWFEDGLKECFNSLDLNFMTQLEIAVSHQGTPIRGHLDFTFFWKKPAIRVVEIKSMSKLPAKAYAAHEFQAKAQIGFVRYYWDQPVFSLKDATGKILYANLTFPEICKRFLGIHLPDSPDKISVESWLLCFSMKDAVSFGPFSPDMDFIENALELAEKAWAQYGILRHNTLTLNDLPHASGYQPLCAYCQFASDCPRFKVDSIKPEWEGAMDRLDCLKAQREALDSEIRSIEGSLRQTYELAGVKGWIETGSHKFRVSEAAGRKMLDRQTLALELTEIFEEAEMGYMDVAELFSRHEKTGASSSRLSIMRTTT